MSLINKRVDGIILSPIAERNGTIQRLKNADVPFVLINYIPDDKSLNYVAFNNYEGGKIVAEHVNTLDKAQVIMITGHPHQTLEDRARGFFDFINDPDDVIRYGGIETFDDGVDIVNVLISRHSINTKKTILYVTNDNVSIGIINKLYAEGIETPDQVSVIGFDDIKMAALCRVPLTTISQSIRDMGKLAAYDLMDMINGSIIRETGHIIQPRLIIRESSR